jgi:hypothetical protein
METTIIVALIGLAASVGAATIVAITQVLLGRKIQRQGKNIDDLYALSMSNHTFDNLIKFKKSFGPYWIDENDLSWGLNAELNYLLMLGYIEFDPKAGKKDMRELPRGKKLSDGNSGAELSDYLRITDQGLAFIGLREEALERRA